MGIYLVYHDSDRFDLYADPSDFETAAEKRFDLKVLSLLCFCVIVFLTGCYGIPVPPNFHRVSEDLYRSGQPDEDEFESLYTFNGIRSVLNLRASNRDKKAIASINRKWKNAFVLYEIPLDTGNITEKELLEILTVIRDAPKPLLVHCWQGSNRTGCVVAAYRIVFENWSVEKAVSELTKPEYGYFKLLYPYIPELLRKINWDKIKSDLNLPPRK